MKLEKTVIRGRELEIMLCFDRMNDSSIETLMNLNQERGVSQISMNSLSFGEEHRKVRK